MATGQTGIAISGWGIAVDHGISDFVAGAASKLVHDGAERALALDEQQRRALGHPAYSGVTLGLLHGSKPDLLILCHRAGATDIDDYPGVPIRPLPELIQTYEAATAWVDHPARVVAIAVNTRGLDDDAARAELGRVSAETGLPADDPVRFGGDRLLDALGL